MMKLPKIGWVDGVPRAEVAVFFGLNTGASRLKVLAAASMLGTTMASVAIVGKIGN